MEEQGCQEKNTAGRCNGQGCGVLGGTPKTQGSRSTVVIVERLTFIYHFL